MVFEFVAIGDEVEELVKEEEGWKKTQGEEEQKEEEEEVEETKRQQFVDTADSAVDEEVEAEADTDKIGEKGTLARDTAPDEGPAEEGPKLEGDTDIPAIGGPPGLGPGYTGGFAEMLADVVNEQEIVTGEPEEFEETEETGDADSTIEGEDSVAEAESEEAPSETMASDETSPLELEEVTQPDEVVAQETPTAETSAEEIEGT